MKNPADRTLRTPIVEGILYPSEREELTALVRSFTADAMKGEAPVIVSPHAGYSTAGALMGMAYSAAAKRGVKTVVLLSPVHREEQENIILPSFTRFRTPSGDLEVDLEALELFAGHDNAIIRNDIPHLEEHSIEDQLPFVIELFPEAKILPVLLGRTTITLVKKLTAGLERAFGTSNEEVLFAVTSNLSLYEKRETALEQASASLKLFREGDWRTITEERRTGNIHSCGAGALAAVLALYTPPLSMKVLGQSEPGGKESEKGKTVSYGAIAFEEV